MRPPSCRRHAKEHVMGGRWPVARATGLRPHQTSEPAPAAPDRSPPVHHINWGRVGCVVPRECEGSRTIVKPQGAHSLRTAASKPPKAERTRDQRVRRPTPGSHRRCAQYAARLWRDGGRLDSPPTDHNTGLPHHKVPRPTGPHALPGPDRLTRSAARWGTLSAVVNK